jgi:sortase B
VLAVASIGMGVRELCVPAIEGARLHSMSRVASTENGSVDGTSVENGADAPEQTDWVGLRNTNGDVCAWLTVMGTDIDYAVCQGDDNEWYLHHDVYGTPNSLCGVFADYRCDVGSANTLIYGHTVSTGGMFAPISDVYHPGRLAEIGDVVMDTPSTGQVFYHPLCAMSVESDYGKIQRFDMQPSTRDFRSWVRSLLDDADERVEGADELAARANKVLVLVCCSADTNTRRSVLVSVC